MKDLPLPRVGVVRLQWTDFGYASMMLAMVAFAVWNLWQSPGIVTIAIFVALAVLTTFLISLTIYQGRRQFVLDEKHELLDERRDHFDQSLDEN